MKQSRHKEAISSTFRPRDSVIAGLIFHGLSVSIFLYFVYLLIVSFEYFLYIIFIIALLYVFKITTLCFIIYGITINRKVNKLLEQEVHWLSDTRVIARGNKFEIEGVEAVLQSEEKSHISLHEKIYRYIHNDVITWILQCFLAPLFFLPHQLIHAFKRFSKDTNVIAKNLKIDEAFDICEYKGQKVINEMFAHETEDVKGSLFVLFVLYEMLVKGFTLEFNRLKDTNFGSFMKNNQIDQLQFLYVGTIPFGMNTAKTTSPSLHLGVGEMRKTAT